MATSDTLVSYQTRVIKCKHDYNVSVQAVLTQSVLRRQSVYSPKTREPIDGYP